MAPRKLPDCGFAVEGTKKGELLLRIEKRARGKKVTIIPNVIGEAMRLARALQGMLGVGGTARQAEKGAWTVEVQGDQIPRVTRALLDFDCLVGLTKSALDDLKSKHTAERTDAVVGRSSTSKYLAQTQEGGRLSMQEERRRAIEQEAEFYMNFWSSTAEASDDWSDVWDTSLTGPDPLPAESLEGTPGQKEQGIEELNIALKALGMLADQGDAIKEFWRSSGMTVSQFRKMALNPGARLITDAAGRVKAPSNLKSRQKMSDRRVGGGKGSYFTPTVRAIDDYEKGITGSRGDEEADGVERAEEPKIKVVSDDEGWCSASCRHSPSLQVPPTRLDEKETTSVSRAALVELLAELQKELDAIQEAIPGLSIAVDSDIFAVLLRLSEQSCVQPGKRNSAGAPSKDDKEEMRLEKKLREISALKRQQMAGEATLDKLQLEKIQKKDEVFLEVAELKFRRAERELQRVFKKQVAHFKDIFWKLEWPAMYGDDAASTTADGTSHDSSSPAESFGIFDESNCSSKVSLLENASLAECKGAAQQWEGVRLHIPVRVGEVAAYAIEVIDGMLRVGWTAASSSSLEVGRDDASFGFGATGKKVQSGNFEPYGASFKAGDVIHCEAERDQGKVRIGFAKNSEPLGIAFELDDELADDDTLVGSICGKGLFKARILSAERLSLEEAPDPISAELPDYVEYDPAVPAQAIADFREDSEVEDSYLQFFVGDYLYVSANDGEGYCFGYFLDPDDGGWFPADCVRLLESEDDGHAEAAVPETDEWAAPLSGGGAEPESTADDWGAPPLGAAEETADDWDRPVPLAAENSMPSQQQGVASAASRQSAPSTRPNPAAAAAPTPTTSTACPVAGLSQWLADLTLQRYEAKAAQWCKEMGAVSIEEVEECWEDFAEQLALKPLERKRLAKKVAR